MSKCLNFILNVDVFICFICRYAVRESGTTIKLFKNFKERTSFKPDFGCDSMYGGHLMGVRTSQGLAFYDWEKLELIRRIEIAPKNVNSEEKFITKTLFYFSFPDILVG